MFYRWSATKLSILADYLAVDILQGTGWWEQPAGGANSGLWTLHEVPFGQGPNPFRRDSDLLVYDVNKDGLPDVISSLFSHGPGLAWFEQHRKGNSITFEPHIIMNDPNTPMSERSTWDEMDKSIAFTEPTCSGIGRYGWRWPA